MLVKSELTYTCIMLSKQKCDNRTHGKLYFTIKSIQHLFLQICLIWHLKWCVKEE